ncbi:endonuclease [Rossellomorea oryzaecorticis]|uniref:Endonuclease n=1 Tax=Rossellomorea oryzaecorticis TaxID=1396505 RepID=A0ABW8VLH7_9BACI
MGDDIEFFDIMNGKLLGDGCITKQEGRKPRFQFTHSKKDKEWCEHCYSTLRDHLPLNAPKYKKVKDQRVQSGYTEGYYVQSKTHEAITVLRNLWYKDGQKILPLSFISDHLTARTLAWWYQDDGHLKIQGNIPKKIILSTESFSPLENLQLCKLLKEKFHLSFSQDKQNRIILYDKFQILYFLKLIEPYLHPSMNRKFIPFFDISFSEFTSRRTTIYLPEYLSLKSPTAEINKRLLLLDQHLELYRNERFYSKESLSFIESSRKEEETRSYQIMISQGNIQRLKMLSGLTGLNNSLLTLLCFQYIKS